MKYSIAAASAALFIIGLLAYLMWGGEEPVGIDKQLQEQVEQAQEWGK